MRVSATETPAGRSMRERKPIVFSKEELQGFDDETARGLLAEGLQSLCCVPLIRPKGLLGVVVLGSTRADAFRTEDVQLINQVATQLAIAIENHRTAAEVEQLKQRLGEERSYLEGESRSEGEFPEIIGDSIAIRQVLDQVATVGASEATVLILGETGTGKELITHAIHSVSRVKKGPFIKVNCAAIPTGLLESELFGHEKGAFTGAVSRKIGRMELADGGTLFLDEVGEIPTELQPKLLRVLQDQEFEGLGSTRTVKVKVRVIAATNRNLKESLARREFRQRSILSPQRIPDPGAFLAGTPRGHSIAYPAFRPQICAAAGSIYRNHSQGNHESPDAMGLARECPGTRKLNGAIGHFERGTRAARPACRIAHHRPLQAKGRRPNSRHGRTPPHYPRPEGNSWSAVRARRRRAKAGTEEDDAAIQDAATGDFS